MKPLYKLSYSLGIVLLSAFLLLNACKRDSNPSPADPDKLTARDIDSLKFYVWFINVSDSASNVPFYLWEDQVPEHFPWYSAQYATGNDVMRGIASYPTYQGQKVDRYSFIDMTGEVSDQLQGGIKGDYGYMVAATQDDNGKFHLYIEYSYKGAPSRKAGIMRGDEIVAIDKNTNMDLSSQSNVDRINDALFSSESVSLELRRPDSTSTFIAQLQPAQYHLNPVLFDSVYTIGNKKIGYFVYNSFVSVSSDENGTTARKEIDGVFSKFVDEGVNELIVDLRYNGGGAVSTSEYLDELIAPADVMGKEMYHYEYNQKLTDFFGANTELTQDYLMPIKFDSSTSGLNLNRVFFIVSRSTASASELTINNLKPYMDVKLVGDTTYGKPVGFFTIPIDFVTENGGKRHVADMYSINFKSVNSAGQTDYYFGLKPDVRLYDYVDLRWGDPRDQNLASIFNYIQGDGFLTVADFTRKAQQLRAQLKKAPGKEFLFMRKIPASIRIKDPHAFNGMVDYRKNPVVLPHR